MHSFRMFGHFPSNDKKHTSNALCNKSDFQSRLQCWCRYFLCHISIDCCMDEMIRYLSEQKTKVIYHLAMWHFSYDKHLKIVFFLLWKRSNSNPLSFVYLSIRFGKCDGTRWRYEKHTMNMAIILLSRRTDSMEIDWLSKHTHLFFFASSEWQAHLGHKDIEKYYSIVKVANELALRFLFPFLNGI